MFTIIYNNFIQLLTVIATVNHLNLKIKYLNFSILLTKLFY